MDKDRGMPSYPDKYFDLAIVDPYYGIGMDNSNKRTKPSRPNSYVYYPDFRYKDADWDKQRVSEGILKEIFRVSKNQILWGANYYCNLIPEGKGWIFWHKQNGDDNCFSDGEFAYQSFEVRSRWVSISQFDGLNGGKDRIHPTQKPIKLYKWLLSKYAKPNDKILDTHVGSASSLIACEDMGFEYTGFELDSDYFNAANKRLEQFRSQLKLAI